MLKDFRRKNSLLQRVRQCRLVVTHSKQMENEMSRHVGLHKVRRIPFCLPVLSSSVKVEEERMEEQITVLFLGRMESERGGDYLIRAIPFMAPEVLKTLRLVMAGQGTKMDEWMLLARQMQERFPMVSIEFPGWLDGEAKIEAFRQASVTFEQIRNGYD